MQSAGGCWDKNDDGKMYTSTSRFPVVWNRTFMAESMRPCWTGLKQIQNWGTPWVRCSHGRNHQAVAIVLCGNMQVNNDENRPNRRAYARKGKGESVVAQALPFL